MAPSFRKKPRTQTTNKQVDEAVTGTTSTDAHSGWNSSAQSGQFASAHGNAATMALMYASSQAPDQIATGVEGDEVTDKVATGVTGNPNNSEVLSKFPNFCSSAWRYLDVDSHQISNVPGQGAGYNCYAHSVGSSADLQVPAMAEAIGWDGPIPMGGGAEKLEIFDRFFATKGFGKVTLGASSGADIVLFGTSADNPVHAAKKSTISVGSGTMYESKLYFKELLLHTLAGMEGGIYGSAIRGYSAG
jgi:hypothetical protein